MGASPEGADRRDTTREVHFVYMRKEALHVEPEVHDVAVFDFVGFSFNA